MRERTHRFMASRWMWDAPESCDPELLSSVKAVFARP